jgi:Family of unknown function (DUF5681)
MPAATSTTKQRVIGRPFARGQSGNPKGRPHGARNHATILLDQLAEGSATKLLRTVIAKAQKGDMSAAALVLARIWPPRKGRPVHFPLPELNTPADLPGAMAMLLKVASRGGLSPDEVALLATALDGWRRSVESADFEQRLTALEARSHARD